MQQSHYHSRNTIICWNMFRLLMVPMKIIFGLLIFRWEFITNAFFAMFLTLFYLVSIGTMQICCGVILWLAEMGESVSALIYFIVLSTSSHAERFFWITCVFCAIDLTILMGLTKSMLNYKSIRSLPPYTPPRRLNRVSPPTKLQNRKTYKPSQITEKNLQKEFAHNMDYPEIENPDLKKPSNIEISTILNDSIQQSIQRQVLAKYNKKNKNKQKVNKNDVQLDPQNDEDLFEVECDDHKKGLKCCICSDRDRNCVFIPCGHVSCCQQCANSWRKKNNGVLTCFVCKALVTKVCPIYFS